MTIMDEERRRFAAREAYFNGTEPRYALGICESCGQHVYQDEPSYERSRSTYMHQTCYWKRAPEPRHRVERLLEDGWEILLDEIPGAERAIENAEDEIKFDSEASAYRVVRSADGLECWRSPTPTPTGRGRGQGPRRVTR